MEGGMNGRSYVCGGVMDLGGECECVNACVSEVMR